MRAINFNDDHDVSHPVGDHSAPVSEIDVSPPPKSKLMLDHFDQVKMSKKDKNNISILDDDGKVAISEQSTNSSSLETLE